MLKIGITGGIGSGKTVVCQVFNSLGIPVFNADDAAKYLMEHDAALKANISELLGSGVYENGKLIKGKVTDIIFRDPSTMALLNAMVHPATIAYAAEWMNRQTGPYLLKEAALFFESGSNTGLDAMIGVYAPQELRVARVMARSNMPREKVLSIIASQMNEEEKMSLCDYVITNDDVTAVLPQVLQLHQRFCNFQPL